MRQSSLSVALANNRECLPQMGVGPVELLPTFKQKWIAAVGWALAANPEDSQRAPSMSTQQWQHQKSCIRSRRVILGRQ